MDNSIKEYAEDRISKEGFLTTKNRNKNNKIKKIIISVSSIVVAISSLLFGCGKKDKTESRNLKQTVHETESPTRKSNTVPETTTRKSNTKSETTTKKSDTKSETTTKKTNTKTETTTKSNTKTNSTSSKTESTTKKENKNDDSFVVKLDTPESTTLYPEESTTYPDGTIIYNENNNIDYKIVDENGELVSYGSYGEDNSISGYVYDKLRNEPVRADEVGKYIYSDIDFYDSFGNIVINKGDLISIETYIYAKMDLNYENVSNVVNDFEVNNDGETIYFYVGILNEDGTYTVKDVTFESKEVFEYFLLDSEGFYMDENRIVRPISELKLSSYQKSIK